MTSTVDVPNPAGYSHAVPFDRKKHRGLGVATNASRFAQKLHALFLTSIEIPRAALDYPVVFARDGAQTIVPVALMGVEPNHNLFCDKDGNWPPEYYVPAYVRRYPFFLARINGAEKRGLICVDEPALVPDTVPLINDNGEATQEWVERQKLIEQMDVEGQRTREFCARLDKLGLFETFDADFHPRASADESSVINPVRINGLLRVGRDALSKLSDADLAALVRTQEMQVIDAHLNSLARFDRLLNRFAATASRRD